MKLWTGTKNQLLKSLILASITVSLAGPVEIRSVPLVSVPQSSQITVAQARQIDPSLNDLADEQLQEVLSELYELGFLALEFWQINKPFGSKIPFGLLPKLKPGDTI